MILVDSRAGSKDLLEPLAKRGLPVELGSLEFGDVVFAGSGPEGNVLIAIEYKHMGEALACMTTGRFAGHQLVGMQEAGYYAYWLLIDECERYATGEQGQLQTRYGRGWVDVTQGERAITFAAWSHWLMSLELVGGCHIHMTETRSEAVDWIAAAYTWWQKEWWQHKSVVAFNKAGELTAKRNGNILVRPTLAQLWAAELPGIGHDKSGLVAAKLHRAEDIVHATVDDWRVILSPSTVKGKLADKVHAAIRKVDYRG